MAKKKKMFKVRDKVYDAWWIEDIGMVIKVLKTRIKVSFLGDMVTYDNAHAKKFLRLYRKGD